MVGMVPDVIRNVARHPFFQENIRFSVTRAGDYNAAAKIVLFEYEGRPTSTKKRDLDYFASSGSIERERLELAARRAVDTLDNMQEVFLPRDQILSSAGPLPVYYWLIRTMAFGYQKVLREYLLDFETARAEHRELQIRGGQSPEISIFSRYDTLNRSINDVGSHVGRFEILRDEFPSWLARKGDQSLVGVVLKT
jgi:hypothetical protein